MASMKTLTSQLQPLKHMRHPCFSSYSSISISKWQFPSFFPVICGTNSLLTTFISQLGVPKPLKLIFQSLPALAPISCCLNRDFQCTKHEQPLVVWKFVILICFLKRNWEIDLDAVEAIADANTIAMVVINPVRPCGNVLSYRHLAKVAETARKLGILILADEVYSYLTFDSEPSVPMGVFGSIAPILTLGSISKRWVVPGWRIGWLVTCDPNGFLKKTKIVDCIKGYLNVSFDPAAITQAALQEILKKTSKDFFDKTVELLKQTTDICYDGIKELACIDCAHKPEGSMFMMVKLDVSHLQDIHDDMDFCVKLAKEESVILLPGSAFGMKSWLRVTFAIEPSLLEEGLARLKAFCYRHAKLA